jgi:hypothetical protein
MEIGGDRDSSSMFKFIALEAGCCRRGLGPLAGFVVHRRPKLYSYDRIKHCSYL